MTWVQGEKKMSALFIDLVRAVDAANPQVKRLHFILDNAVTHCSMKTQKALEEIGGGWCCTSCRRTAPRATAVSASGGTRMPTSPATIAARRWRRSWPRWTPTSTRATRRRQPAPCCAPHLLDVQLESVRELRSVV
ncbi:IS630 family transposase [Corallococcus coralloides DSM 2259]|uniref:IS630 family transposase n=1 Tax=Corallococcus coralloides (strain ATCC 25202 / DSM 2259 / NBRC 100086 / M2) TaxID=1144275 RepID=H8MKX2_CORCM|nr:IS630 family transposase [Corallococcus coralloides DSM 2259]